MVNLVSTRTPGLFCRAASHPAGPSMSQYRGLFFPRGRTSRFLSSCVGFLLTPCPHPGRQQHPLASPPSPHNPSPAAGALSSESFPRPAAGKNVFRCMECNFKTNRKKPYREIQASFSHLWRLNPPGTCCPSVAVCSGGIARRAILDNNQPGSAFPGSSCL